MFCAPVVAWETSLPPTTPRGTSRSAPGLTTFMRPPPWPASLPPLAFRAGRGRNLDLQRRRLVVDLEGGVVDVEAFLEQLLKRAAQLVAVVPGPDHHVGRERGKPRGDLPHVQVVHLDDPGLAGQRVTDLLGIETGGRGLHEHPAGGLEQDVCR